MKARWSYLRQLLFRRLIGVVIGAYGLIGAIQWGADQFGLPQRWHERLTLGGIVPTLPLWAWICGSVGLLSILAVEGGFRDRRRLEAEIVQLADQHSVLTNVQPRILIASAGELPHPTEWAEFNTGMPPLHGGLSTTTATVLTSHWFTHIRFVNRPINSTSESVAKSVAARIEVFSLDGHKWCEWQGKWSNTSAISYDQYDAHRISIYPDGVPIALDLCLRNPAAGTVFGFNSDNSAADKLGFDQSKAINNGRYYVCVTLQGVMLNATQFWLDFEVIDVKHPVILSPRQSPPDMHELPADGAIASPNL